MRYKIFAQDAEGNEHSEVVEAESDDEAMQHAILWFQHKYKKGFWAMAGVRENDSRFYTATKLSDLVE